MVGEICQSTSKFSPLLACKTNRHNKAILHYTSITPWRLVEIINIAALKLVKQRYLLYKNSGSNNIKIAK
jgi:hypothetical protein